MFIFCSVKNLTIVAVGVINNPEFGMTYIDL